MAGSETMKTTIATSPTKKSQPTARRFVGVRQRPSGRWVAEIKDSSQRVRLWLGTYDTPEEAARAYDEAARALRGENARTNFAMVNQSDSSQSPCPGLSFSSLKAKLSKNLQNIMARNSENKSSCKSRVSDHFTFASIFHYRGNYQYQKPVDLKNIEKVVQPSVIVPRVPDDQPSSWESSDCSNELMAMRHHGLDLEGSSDVSEVYLGFDQQDQMIDWTSSPDLISESSRSKRFKVSSSVVIPPSFSDSPWFCESPYNREC